MAEIVQAKPQLDWGVYVENRGKWGVEELRPYAGQWLGWSFDGARIVVHHADLECLAQQLLQLGIASDEVVIEQMPEVENFEACL